MKLNPFVYGGPVYEAEFVDRERALRAIFAHIVRGRSLALVGGPFCGKSSVLRYVECPGIWKEWLGERAEQYIVSPIHCHSLQDGTLKDFWKRALAPLLHPRYPYKEVTAQAEAAERDGYDESTLRKTFDLLAQMGRKLVLLIDEFPILFAQQEFESGFFGLLDDLTTKRNRSLVLIVTSRQPIAQVRRQGSDAIPLRHVPSCFLHPLGKRDIAKLLKLAWEETRVQFDNNDWAYLQSTAGGCPFFVQLTAAALWDAINEGLRGEQRYRQTGWGVYRQGERFFKQIWHHLPLAQKQALTVVGVRQMQGQLGGYVIDLKSFSSMSDFQWDLERLQQKGLVEIVQEKRDSWWGLVQIDEKVWRIAPGCFIWWLGDTLVSEIRKQQPEVGFHDWLVGQGMEDAFTKEDQRAIGKWAQEIGEVAFKGAEIFIEKVAQGAAKAMLQTP